ncbi:2-amino-4-hydroxy-6-hydroxymethyldihydropteridine diphosphokinase [Aminobacter sp. P9b]|uniref:2-amino-4-hydroxy-6-hydroxymethyldihydropteridine pyrophosphokinase n=1 Tax=Aminobacter niigataensis TaxID=83265 RepID=A0ABR6KX11_9HYPH|nr:MULTISPECIES: 2-amino-4-hydroxy-6-hydroxymethyldihydropteridine diphosphokinase [Aminobacter]AWC23823.1 2-amino-4-hydroxy-6-hydroxymethyldihydropteridine pyrophosphokinase [Aminobacter sp. MSH1]MBB4649067.1 2-amino-4-hydroxy-6-hydroxymethyldihydropteridine diphosphokinase [Aminobacter niigataensis]CAI2934508.1 2-amino-4-hydroxy-6-hydroxymethyldihydropteridinepyrophosphokinase [Aminobacter niigataensis]
MSGQAEERAFLSLGGNLGDPAKSMAAALHMLDASGQTRVVTVSSLHRTPPWGKVDQPDFLNVTAEVATSLSPLDLLELCLEVERRLKRVRVERWGPRLIDIDVLLHGESNVSDVGLEIPHPRMLDRAFVMVPLAEIAPELVLAGKSSAEWATALDSAGIERLDSGRDWWRNLED